MKKLAKIAVVVLALGGGPATAAPSCDAPPSTLLVTVELTTTGSPAMPQRKLPAGKRIGHGGIVQPALPGPDRVAIAVGRKGALIDARSGRVLAQLPAPPDHVSPRAGAIVLEGQPPRLLRLADSQLVTPAFEPGARKLRARWLAASRYHDGVVGLAEDAEGNKLFALATADLARLPLRLAPFDAAWVNYSAILNAGAWELRASADRMDILSAGTPFVDPHGTTCMRARVRPDGEALCLEYAPAKGGESIRWLHEGWFFGAAWVGNEACPNKHLAVGDESKCHTRATLVEPPRAVVTCFDDQQAFLWTPERIFRFIGPSDSNDLGGLVGADAGPVLPLFEGPYRAGDTKPSRRWIDLVGAREYATPPLVALGVAAFNGVASRALAEERHGRSADVYLLDFDKTHRELVARVTDCPGPLQELVEDGPQRTRRFLVLACMEPARAGQIPSRFRWAEIVDTERRIRLRTTSLPELIFDDGLAVLSQRHRLAAETKADQAALFAVDLLAP